MCLKIVSLLMPRDVQSTSCQPRRDLSSEITTLSTHSGSPGPTKQTEALKRTLAGSIRQDGVSALTNVRVRMSEVDSQRERGRETEGEREEGREGKRERQREAREIVRQRQKEREREREREREMLTTYILYTAISLSPDINSHGVQSSHH